MDSVLGFIGVTRFSTGPGARGDGVCPSNTARAISTALSRWDVGVFVIKEDRVEKICKSSPTNLPRFYENAFFFF